MDKSVEKSIERRKLILSGDIFKTIVIVCFPLAIYQFFNSVSTVIDQIICSNISAEASNAVGSIAQLKNAISAFGAGLAAGGAVLVSRLYGAGKIKDAKKASGNLFILALIMSAIIIVLFMPLAVPLMKLCQISETAIAIGKTYFILQLFELALVSINNVFIGLEKAKGNSKIILYLNVIVLIIKLGLSAIFVYGFHFKDIMWIEIATIIAQSMLTMVGFYFMFRKSNILQITIGTFRLDKSLVKTIMILSIPIFFGKFVMNLGKVTVNALCGGFYNATTDGLIVGALGVSNNISGLTTSITTTFEDSESSIVSQNLGNRNLKRSLKIFTRVFCTAIVISIIGYILTRFILLNQVISLFQGNDDKGIYYSNMIKEIYVYDSLSILALGACSAVLGLLYGFGKTFLASILNFCRIGVRIVSIIVIHYAFPNISGPSCAGISMGISNCTIFLLAIVFFIIFYTGLKKNGYRNMHLEDPEPGVSDVQF